ncbi:MAG: hypothetical protein J1E40_08360 [Oscillospiraceae bacterium]|nr:hypothetical protein [Oscillospiraceae bacterium]
METKVGIHIQSSFSKYNGDPVAISNHRKEAINSSKKSDNFAWKSLGGTFDLSGIYSGDMLRQMEEFRKNLQQDGIQHIEVKRFAEDDYLGKAEMAYDFFNQDLHDISEGFSKKLKEFGVPEDITFEFDYDLDNGKAVLTNISDEKYRDSVQEILDKSMSPDWVANASRIVNGYMSSIYYANISKALERCFGQDISELYIDEKGNIGGVNKNLQMALAAEKSIANFDAKKMYDFPVNQIEAMLKRLITDENITPNISHMGYDGNGIYTNDGDIQFGKEIDPSLWEDNGFLRRMEYGYIPVSPEHYDFWLNNEDMFY